MNETWEDTDRLLAVVFKDVFDLCEIKPSKGDPTEREWMSQMQEVRSRAISIHNRRIAINMERNNERKS